MGRLAAALVFAAVAFPPAAHAKFACVTNVDDPAARFAGVPACAPCRDAVPPPYCFIRAITPDPLSVALAATQAGDQVFIDAAAILAAGAVVDGEHVIGGNPFGDPGGAVIANTAAAGLTVHRGTIESIVAVSGALGVSGIEIALEQATCESPARCDVLVNDTWTVAGEGAYGMRLVSSPPGWVPDGSSIGQVTVEELFDGISFLSCNYGPFLGQCGCPGCKPCCPGYTCQAGTCVGSAPPPEIQHAVLDGQAIFTCRDCRIDLLTPGVGFDVLQSRGPLTAFVDSALRPFENAPAQYSPDYRWSLRRSCHSRVEVVGARFAREPSSGPLCSANPIKEVTGGPTPCAGDTLINVPGVCGGTFVSTPNALGTFRPSFGAMPFACPGTNPNASAIGSRWYNTTAGTEAICTASGWKTFALGS